MKLKERFNTFHLTLSFAVTFLSLYPFILIPIQKVQWHRIALKIQHLWARLLFAFMFTKIKIEWNYRPTKKQQFIICTNHFSYIDIPIISYLPYPIKFIGKSSLTKLPLFGYMYKKLHICVDRSSFRSRAQSLSEARDMADKGYILCFYPEGGIRSKKIPQMASFKDGAFRLATEKNLPIVPITFPDNYKFLSDDGSYLVSRRPLRVVVHEPLFPSGNDEKSIENLKNKTYETIQNQLDEMCGIS